MQKELSEMSLEELWQLFPIILTEHKDEWYQWYQEECENLETILGDVFVKRISHIGSTAIKGIYAKPTVDILVEITNKGDIVNAEALLFGNGYLCMSRCDTRVDMNKGYTKNGFASRVFHIHVRISGDNDELYFRDYMNDNPQLAKEYEALKLSLWKRYEHDRDAYTNAKTDFIKTNTSKAKLVYAGRYS